MRKYYFLSLLFLPTVLSAQKPWNEAITGQITRSGFSIGKCNIGSMTIKYSVSTLVGEATTMANFKWTPGYGTDPTCLSGEHFEIFLKLNAGGSEYFVGAGEGAIPKGNGEYGYNPMPGSPFWDKALIPAGYRTVKAFQQDRKYLSASQAKSIWKAGFRVLGVVFIDKEGNQTEVFKYGL